VLDLAVMRLKRLSTTVAFQDASSIEEAAPVFTLEVGAGSGVVTAHLAALIRASGRKAVHWITDINVAAANATIRTGEANNV